ncbi:MAG TPA: isocitrate/isopropylmalate dehydrogenase family protein, partial [Methanothrix soehngenii]|nr:isocitrate/isopropylmalate dehydrogenase family protein [Methanothrix soehngenii]
MNHTGAIERAKEHFAELLNEQLKRVDQMKAGEDWADYSRLMPIIIGVVGGDGIGPFITKEAVRVLEYVLADEIQSGKV